MQRKKILLAIVLITIIHLTSYILHLPSALAVHPLSSDNYQIDWPNLNMGAGLPSSDTYNLGVTTGQIAPGLYESYGAVGYKVRAGFQYIHSIIPFTFTLDKISIDFGSLTPSVLTNEETITLTVNSGSAGGYQVTAEENDRLTSTAGSHIEDVTCDAGDTCTHIDEGAWAQTSTYGFGYTMTGDDVPSEFASGTKFKNFADVPGDPPQKVMGLTPDEGHEAGTGKEAVMTIRINISGTQAAGVYENIISFVATPTY